MKVVFRSVAGEFLFSGFKKCLGGGCTEITEKGRALEESRVVPEMFCSFFV